MNLAQFIETYQDAITQAVLRKWEREILGTAPFAMAAELESMASWLGLESIAVERKGDLAEALRRFV